MGDIVIEFLSSLVVLNSMRDIRNEIGNKYNNLTVIGEHVERNQQGLILWLCKCDCGNEHVASGNSLRSGNCKSCGCVGRKRKVTTEVGKKYGNLTVVSLSTKKSRRRYWDCICDCGNTRCVRGDHLKKGRRTQCALCSQKIIIKNELGNKYGKLTVISLDQTKKIRKMLFWNCQCECGNIKSICGAVLRKGKKVHCGCGPSEKIQIGDKQGLLTILSRNNEPYCHKGPRWNCICECGKDTIVRSINWAKGHVKSCGCLRNKKLPDGEASFKSVLYSYKYAAKKAGREFSLSDCNFRELTKSNCYYCNVIPMKVGPGDYSKYIYNGIDRIDSNLGYTIDNCRPCCTDCNKMKSIMRSDDFLGHIGRIYNWRINSPADFLESSFDGKPFELIDFNKGMPRYHNKY